MGTSGNPAKKAASKAQQAEALKISPVGDFKKRLGGVQTLPSGLVVKVRNPGGMRAFLGTGQIPNSLMGIIGGHLDTGTKPDVAEFTNKQGEFDPEMIKDMQEMMDNIAMRCIVQPKFHPIPTDDDLRVWNDTHSAEEQLTSPEELRDDENVLYIDDLPDDDKMFIFQWVSGGTRDLERFREQREKDLGLVATDSGAGSDS